MQVTRGPMVARLKHLDDPHATLLMYLSGELSAKGRAAVEQRLASDASFAAEFEQLRAVESACDGAFAAADRARALPLKPDVAVRRVSRAMHDWQVRRASQAASVGARPRLRIPVWA